MQVGDVKLVQIDPITAYPGNTNGKVDSYRTTDVRAVLARQVPATIAGVGEFSPAVGVD